MYYYCVALLSSPLEALTYASSDTLEIGAFVEVPLRAKNVNGVVVALCEEPSFQTFAISHVTSYLFSLKQIEAARFIANYYVCSLGEALGLMVPFLDCSVQAKACVTGVCNTDFSPHENVLACEPKVSFLSELTLSPKQTEALEFIQSHKVSLLFGDTGSGKTEIYMKYFQELMACGKRSIFLMPEISLTPQMEQRLKIHFGEQVLLWHSKLTKKQKEHALERLYDGSAKIIAGPRSALFLPVQDLGLIVVDEEHDDSYKSSSRPRYNARDLAIYMGKLYDVPVVLGSATPSLGSYVKFPSFRLKGGHYSSQKEFLYEHGVESISPSILYRLEKGLKAKEQAIVFIPTRANFKHLLCADCGHHYTCSFCSVGMSVHQKMHALKCHYCGFTQAIPQVCSECGSHNLTSSRLGTAEAVKNLQEFFPHATIEQFDRDVITTQNKLKKTLKRFNDKEIDILVGTQMLSKGHDYHDVTLAVVLGMDNMLGMSDYRAREKALATVLQVAGRSGRKKDAHVIVQTFHEDFFRAYIGRYEAFLEDEKEFRKELYPPYKKLCRLLFAHANGHKAREAMEETAVKLRNMQGVEIVGQGKCAIEKVANKYRFEILLRSDKSTDLLRAVRMCAPALAEVDMDPIEFG